MAQLKVPEAPREYATHYEMLLGVDYQADQTQVDRKRSPNMVNMISDVGGNPIKRDGYRRVGRGYTSLLMVNGVIYGSYATSTTLVVNEVELEEYDFAIKQSHTLSKDIGKIMSSFVYQDKIYLVATKGLASFDTIDKVFKYVGIGTNMMSTGTIGESAPIMDGNIPLTTIGLKPDGSAGTAYKDKNVFSIYQQVSYQGNGEATEYVIPTHKKIGTWVKAEVKDENNDWQTAEVTLEESTAVVGKNIDGVGTATNNVVGTKVTFTTAPSAPTVTGEDNVRITFAPYSMEQVSTGENDDPIYKGYYNETLIKLLNSSASTLHNSRMMLADVYKVYYSDVGDMFTVSDLAWFEVDSEVICLTRSSNYLAVITKDNGGNTIFLASEQVRTVDKDSGDTETYFTVKASNSGVGAVAPRCMSTLSDEPMFLSSTGIFGILSNYLSEKYAVNRSSRINRRLCKEPNLSEAVGIAFNDYYFLAVNSRMYVLDGRHKESDRAGNKPFEAYFFEGFPDIKNMFVVGDRMYFSDDSYTYAWNDDLKDSERYYDNAYRKTVTQVVYQVSDSDTVPPTSGWQAEKPTPAEGEYLWYRGIYDNGTLKTTTDEIKLGDWEYTGKPVKAKWSSVFDDDGSPQRLKTLMKKGSMVTIVPHHKSGCEITLVKDGDVSEYLGSFDSTLTSFEYIDFTKFSFKSNAVAVDRFTKKKVKKYKRLQIVVENNKAEPFGLTQITKTYTMGNYAKR